jgi:hypothetical protein
MTTTNEPLSGVDLAIRCAEDVMGWPVFLVGMPDRPPEYGNTYIVVYEGDLYAVRNESRSELWEPWRDPRAYMEIVEHCRELWRTDDPEELYWQFVDCQECGWRVDVMWSHHDGDVDLYSASAETLGEAVMLAALQAVRAQA